MNIFIAMTYVAGVFIGAFAIDRVMHVFFDKRQTSIRVMLLSYAGFMVVASILYFALNIQHGYVHAIAAYSVAFMLAMIMQRFRHLRKNAGASLMYWVSALSISMLSIIVTIMIIAYANMQAVPSVITFLLIIAINIVGVNMHNTLSQAYEDKLKLTDSTSQRMQAMLDSSPLACVVIDENFNIIEVNQRTLELFNIVSPEDFTQDHLKFSPAAQTDGQLSDKKFEEIVTQAFEEGFVMCNWAYIGSEGNLIPCEITMKRVSIMEKNIIMHYIHDLRKVHALQTAKEQMENLAYNDWLTGLHNRRYFMDYCEKTLQECIESGRDFSVIMIDIDFFKNINDTYGHKVGDEVLQIFAKRVKHVLRDDEIVARYGGEEFVVSLPKASLQDALSVGHRIYENIRNLPFGVGDLLLSVTASVGVASKTDDVTTIQGIIDLADDAVYHVKRNGRDMVAAMGENRITK